MSARSLRAITNEMASLAEGPGDPEADHSRADDLLIEALQWFAAAEDRTVEDLTKDLIGNWRQVEKWYA